MNQNYVDICNIGDINRETCDIAAQNLNCITRQGHLGICTYIDPGNLNIGLCRCLTRLDLRPREQFDQKQNPWINTCASKYNTRP
jgi:hypothetical protein